MTDSKWDAPGVVAQIEDYWEGSGSDSARREVAQWMGPIAGNFLDFGCGTARMSQFIAKTARYHGVDGSKEMLAIAKSRVPADYLHLADLSAVPFSDAQFDAALCMEVFRHLADYKPALAELARVVIQAAFVVDVFQESWESHIDQQEILGQAFPNNCWSLPQFLADVAAYFPGWFSAVYTFSNGEVGVRIWRPIGA